MLSRRPLRGLPHSGKPVRRDEEREERDREEREEDDESPKDGGVAHRPVRRLLALRAARALAVRVVLADATVAAGNEEFLLGLSGDRASRPASCSLGGVDGPRTPVRSDLHAPAPVGPEGVNATPCHVETVPRVG